MSITQTIDPPTDVDEYRRDFPDFWKCRANRHDWHDERGGDDFSWIEAFGAYGVATHLQVAECTRCHMVRRKRRNVVVRRGRVRDIVRLTTLYDDTKCREFRAHGVRITPVVVDEMDLRRQIEGEPAIPRPRRTAATVS